MRVLMISLDSSLLGDPHGNTVRRHMAYAERIGELVIVVYNPAALPKTVQRLSDHLTVYPTNTRPYLFPWAAYRVAARVLRERPADIVTTQDPFATGLVGLLLKWRFRLPLDMQNHSSFINNTIWLNERPFRNRVLQTISRFVIRRADTHRVLTQGEKRHYLALGIPDERVTVLNTPTDVGLFAEPVPEAKITALRDKLALAPDAPVVLWVGMPVPFKNITLLLETFAEVHRTLPGARLVLVGDFSKRPDLVRLADPDSVQFAGRVSHDDLPPYYALADVYAHSSLYEGFGKVLVEALAAGTPVVATRADGPCEILRDGETGLICDHTPPALSAAILALLRDPARARVMGAAGRADVLARFDYDRQLDAVAATFRRTLEGHETSTKR
jgi:glycosyltransferase involved in cell wall biosynthesis